MSTARHALDYSTVDLRLPETRREDDARRVLEGKLGLSCQASACGLNYGPQGRWPCHVDRAVGPGASRVMNRY